MISDTEWDFLSVFTRLSELGFSIGVGFDANKPIYVQSTYQKEWQDTYVDKGFLLLDPTITHGQKNRGHITWTELDELYPGNPVMAEARKFGMVEGNTVSLRIDGICTIVSCAGEKWSPDEVRQAKAAASAIHYLVAPDAYPNLLTPSELEVVELMVAGMRDQEIADHLDLKRETIRKRRQMSYEKTGTTSAASLVSFVIRNGWL